MKSKFNKLITYTLMIGASIFALFCLVYRVEKLAVEWPALYKQDDFNHYYAGIWLMLRGIIPYSVDLLQSALGEPFIWSDWQLRTPFVTNPPSLNFVLLPLAVFEPHFAWSIYICVVIASALISLFILLVVFKASLSNVSVFIISLMFISSLSFIENIHYSQLQPIMLLLILLGWLGVRGNRFISPATGAALWGISAALKFYTWPLIFLLLVLRRWHLAISAIGTMLIVLCAPVILFGIEIYTTFLLYAAPVVNKSAVELFNNMSLGRLLTNIYIGSANTPPILSNKEFLFLFLILPTVITALVTISVGRRMFAKSEAHTQDVDYAFAIVSTVSFFCSPVAWEHYLIVFLIPMIIIFANSKDKILTAVLLYISWGLLFQMPYPNSSLSFYGDTLFQPFRSLLVLSLLIILLFRVWILWNKGSTLSQFNSYSKDLH